jgi:hypothetical protein
VAGFIVTADRDEPMLLPLSVQDFVGTDAAVRLIDVLVASLTLHCLGFKRAQPLPTGRPGDEPGALLRV